MSSRIEIRPYDPSWPVRFERERQRLLAALGDVARRIDHNGSTAVPGLAAKPIIDIQISVAALQPMNAYCSPLQRLGYTHVPHADDAFCPFFHRPNAWPHTHHVHVVTAGGDEETRTLAFRDYLRDHPGVAAEYEELKVRLASQSSDAGFASRQVYADAKGEFVERIIREARSQGYPRWI